jgi:3-vinyl bacteriochlorophyllide hydratase
MTHPQDTRPLPLQERPPTDALPQGSAQGIARRPYQPLYTAAQRVRRDATRWTLVQGLLAPVQFIAFAVSAVLVLRYLASGEGLLAASLSFVVKTLLLYTIMVTGCIWEKVVFDRWLFAPAFFWEDVFSMLVLALHTACLVAMATGWLDARAQMLLALAAYAAYVINAAQFLLKLRAARLDEARQHRPGPQTAAQARGATA